MAGILSGPINLDGPSWKKKTWPKYPAHKGAVVRHRTTGVVGKIKRFTPEQTTLVAHDGREHAIPNALGAFSIEGKTVTLVKPAKSPTAANKITTSGSIAATNSKARVAKASRILVEGIHDAELVEKVWGSDLREVGVVVEPLHGADDLAGVVGEFKPSSSRRLGILLDHLVGGSKESRIAKTVNDKDVLISGHPYVDIWQAIRPAAIGIDAWPNIPKSTDWKTGMCAALKFDGPPGALWPQLLGRVESFRDLEPGLISAVEQLIDFVVVEP